VAAEDACPFLDAGQPDARPGALLAARAAVEHFDLDGVGEVAQHDLAARGLLIMRVTGADLAHGGDLESWLTWVADNPALANLSKTLDVLFVPFAVGSVVVYVLLGKARSPRLAWVGGFL
jgi:hypothetical protein